MVTPPLPPLRRNPPRRVHRLAALGLLAAIIAALFAGAEGSGIRGSPFTRTDSLDDIGYGPRGSRLVGVYLSSRTGVVFWDFARKQCQRYEVARGSRVFPVGNRAGTFIPIVVPITPSP